LKDGKFLRPPFDRDKELIEKILREGMIKDKFFGPPLVTEEGLRDISTTGKDLNKGVWEGFIQITTKRRKQ
jgi:hypothetical protein